MIKVLFVTWDGPQVTYLESLFLPIFVRLAKEGISFQVLQFTWGGAERIALARQACEQAGFSYEAVSIWRRPLAAGAMLTALVGARYVKKAVQMHHIDVVMARSTLPALATMLALRDSQCRLVFDADGLPLDERVDFAGHSPSSFSHRLLRDVEAQAVRRADVVLTRSAKAVEILHARAGAGTLKSKFHIVSNGRDTELFSPGDEQSRMLVRDRLKIPKKSPLLVYAGSIGPQYCLAEMLRLFTFVHLQRPDARFLILTGSLDALAPVLDGFPALKAAVSTLSVPAHVVPMYLACADLGLALRKPSFSMQGVAPIKLGEYLLCGLPVVASRGIGNTDAIGPDVGFLVSEMDDSGLVAAANWFLNTALPQRETFRLRCNETGIAHFSLDACVNKYHKALLAL